MDIGEIKKRVKTTFGDEAEAQISSSDIIRWINDAQREAVLQNEGLLEKVWTTDLTANQAEYTLDSNLFALHRIRIKTSTTSPFYWIPWMSGTDFERFLDGWDGHPTGYPCVYTEKDRKVILFPTPSMTVTGGFKYEGSKYPTKISDAAADSTLPDLPEYYHQYIVDYCLMQAYELDEDISAMHNKASVVQATLNFNEARENWYGRDKYPVVLDYYEDYY